jgi:L-fuconolactonase
VKIIDTHIHIWDFAQAEYSWLKGDTSILNRSYAIAELEPARQQAGITEGILVQAANNYEDTDWMLAVAHATPWVKGVVGWLPLQDPAATAEKLVVYKTNTYFKGVRHLIHDEPDARWLLQPAVLESLQILADNHITYDVVGILTEHIEVVLEVAAKVPNLKMVFDHLNQPPIRSKQRFGVWGSLMQQAAQHPNLFVKISGLGTCAGKSWQQQDLAPYIGFVLEHFGTHRCFCGGDWPVSLLGGEYTAIWKAYKDIVTQQAGAAAENIFYHNAHQFYNL